jgi:L-asparaginase
MTSHPDMIAGPGSFDTTLMTVGNGKILTKGGAEGYQAVAVLPGACGPDSPAYGICIKISDGDSQNRARTTVAVELLRQLGALSTAQIDQLDAYTKRPQYNWRHFEVGEIRPCFKID